MDNDTIENLTERILTLEKKLERYYGLLSVQNELDFIMHGTYIFVDDLTNILEGNY